MHADAHGSSAPGVWKSQKSERGMLDNPQYVRLSVFFAICRFVFVLISICRFVMSCAFVYSDVYIYMHIEVRIRSWFPDPWADSKTDPPWGSGIYTIGAITRVQNYVSVLYYTSTIPYYTVLYSTILYYTILYYTILDYIILFYTILYSTILYFTILSSTT